MITVDKVSEIFCAVDEFCKEFERQMDKKSLLSRTRVIIIGSAETYVGNHLVADVFVQQGDELLAAHGEVGTQGRN